MGVEALEPRTPDPVPALVECARGGDRGAYGRLVESHWAALVRLARSVAGEAEAEDAVQEALIAAWGKLASLREPARFGAWVRRLVVHRCLRRTRRRWLLAPLDEAPEPHTAGDPDGEIDVERTLARLAPRQRAVMHLTVIEGMSDREIGEVMGLAPASVRAHRRRAREKLGRLLGEELR